MNIFFCKHIGHESELMRAAHRFGYPGHQIHKAPAPTPLAPKAASTGHNIERCASTATMPALNSKLARPPSRPSPNAIASETSSPLAWYVPSSSPSPN